MESFNWRQPVDMRAARVQLALAEVRADIGHRWRHTDFVFARWESMLYVGEMYGWTSAKEPLTKRSNEICRYLEYGDHLPDKVPDITLSKRSWEKQMGEWRNQYRQDTARLLLAADLLDSLQ